MIKMSIRKLVRYPSKKIAVGYDKRAKNYQTFRNGQSIPYLLVEDVMV